MKQIPLDQRKSCFQDTFHNKPSISLFLDYHVEFYKNVQLFCNKKTVQNPDLYFCILPLIPLDYSLCYFSILLSIQFIFQNHRNHIFYIHLYKNIMFFFSLFQATDRVYFLSLKFCKFSFYFDYIKSLYNTARFIFKRYECIT